MDHEIRSSQPPCECRLVLSLLFAFGVACTGARTEPLAHSPPNDAPTETNVLAASPEPVLSVLGPRHRLELGRHAVAIDADDGGRIVEFSLDGKNAIASKSESPVAYGNSFWPSPQSDWNWPPPPELDRMPWTASAEGRSIQLESGVNAALGLGAAQRVTLEPNGVLRIEYMLVNRGSASKSVAPWQNTRVRPRGLTFYPCLGATLPGSTLKPTIDSGVAWLLHDPSTMTENAKSFADGSEGFLAHVEDGVLFVKVWDDVPREKQAPGEAEIELYVDKTGRFVEIEEQGPYTVLSPGASLSWTVHWLLERLDPETRIEVGSPTLVERARSLARRAVHDLVRPY
jgi:hypothetical protein